MAQMPMEALEAARLRLSTKAILVVGLTVVVLVVGLHFAAKSLLTQRFERLEAVHAANAIGRTEALIQQNQESVRDIAADWAAWTDMWRYMQSKDADFAAVNLNEASLETLRMNYRIIADRSGRVVFTDVLGDGVFSPKSESLYGALKASDAFARGLDGEPTTSIAVIDGMVVLFAAHPIVTITHEGPVQGILAYGRALTPARVQELSRLTRHHVEVFAAGEAPSSLGEPMPLSNQWTQDDSVATHGQTVYLNRPNEAVIASSVVLKNARGEPVAVARAVQSRRVMAEGEIAISHLQVAVVGAGLTLGAVMMLGIELGVVRPLRRIRRDIRAIDPLEPRAARVRVRGGDEVADVARALNTALAGVEVARDQLRASEQRFRTMSESAPLGIFLCDPAGELLFCNTALARLLGTTAERAMGMGWVRCIHDEDRERVQEGWLACVRGADPFHHEHRFVHGDGTEVWARVNAVPVRRGGMVVGYVGTCEDITERLQQDATLRAAIDAAQGACEAKSHFLANMSHEIRTPMAAMLGFIELLDDPSMTAAARADAMATIRRNGEQLLALINDILDVSKIEAGAMRLENAEFDLPRVLTDAVLLFQPLAKKKGLELSLEFASPLPSLVRGDATRVRQVIANLVGNAIKFTSSGSVRVVARADHACAGMMQVRVVDTGIGMSADVVERLFQPFTQADATTTRKFGGTGLGLSISRQLVRLMGGDIKVTSKEGVGSTFQATFIARAVDGTNWLAMPPGMAMVDDVATAAASAEPTENGDDRRAAPAALMAAASDGALAGLRVLVAEDGVDNRRLVEHYLKRAGARVELVEDGQAAVNRLSAGGDDTVDIVLMDIQMPVLDGYQATRQLRQSGFHKPIVALTAHAMAEDRERCLSAGCDGYMSKPLDRGALIALVAKLTRRSGSAEAA